MRRRDGTFNAVRHRVRVPARGLRDIAVPQPVQVGAFAAQEDVDVVGLSILSGAHMTLFPRVRELLHEQGRDDILITGGGIIPKEDMDALRARFRDVREKFEPEMQKIREDQRQRISELLSPSQQAEWQKIMEERQRRREGKKGREGSLPPQ